MGAYIAALAIACYANHKQTRPVATGFFHSCEYCGRAPDAGQKSSQCISCGAALKQSAATPGVDYFPHSAASEYWSDARKKEVGYFSKSEPSAPESIRSEEIKSEETKSEPYTPSPPAMDMSDMLHPANPIGIFSPIWHH
jgi:hypothetical protein